MQPGTAIDDVVMVPVKPAFEPQYFLPDHVRLCVTEDGAVLLDLKRDRYVGLGPPEVAVLAELVKGWPKPHSCSIGPAPSNNTHHRDVIDRLCEENLLTSDCRIGKETIAIELVAPHAYLRDGILGLRCGVTLKHVKNIVIAYLTAVAVLHFQPLLQIVRRIQRRKQRSVSLGLGQFDPRLARELLTAYLSMRPMLFSAKDKCLLDSLTLLEFLAKYGVFPTWVIGVTTGPFGAHSWIQEAGFVLNATLEQTREFVPILVV